MKHALDDIVVVELAEGVAGAYCAKLFADLGATVVKVERPGGDRLRHLAAAQTSDGTPISGTFLHLATNKRSLVVDDSAAGRARLSRLLDRAHLVVSESTRGTLADWSLDWDAVHTSRPGLSVVHISGYGATGPYADYEWDDLTVQAMAGTLLLQNDPDQDPLRFPGALGFCIVGHMAALGALGAVTVARQRGTGSFVDCSAVEVLASMPPKATTLLAHHYRGGVPRPNAATNPSTLIPTGVFPCGDGHVALMSTPQQLREMLDVLDDDDLRAAFARPDAYERGETKEAVDAALYPWLLSHTRAEATALAQAAGWPFAGVNTPEEVLAADHLHQRGFWVHSDDPTAGPIDLPGPWCRFGEGGWALRRLAPALGQRDPELEALLAGDAPGDSAGDSAGDEAASTPSAIVRDRAPEPPLRGVRVVDLTTVWAGPYAAMLMADLGAEVIRVENPFVLPPTTKGYQPRPTISDLGFLSSGYGPAVADRPDRPWNRHSLNNSICRNKLSCTMDTRRAEGRELLMRLVEKSDVFIENFKASGLTRMGIQVSELVARNPRLIVVRMPPAGHTGDWAHYAGFGAQFDGLSGLAYVCGHVGSDPVTTPATTYMDCASGPAAAFATFVALRYREVTGRGQVIELPQSENVLNHLGDLYVDCQLGLRPERMGNRNRWCAPQGLYRDADGGWLALSVRDDREWKALTDAIGRADLAGDERFATNAGRITHHDELDAIIGAWTAGRRADDAFHALQEVGVAAAPLLDEAALSADPQIVARGWEQPLLSLDVGVHPHPGLPYRGIPQEWHRGSPVLGQDNEYVFRELLGISPEEYARLQAEHHIAEDYLDPAGAPY